MKIRLNNQGLTLVELLVALALGLILSAGIVNIYIDAKRNYTLEDEAARIQENGRYATNLLKRELAHAGFFGQVVDAGDINPGSIGGTDCAGAEDWALNTTEVAVEFADEVVNGSTPSTSTVTALTCIPSGDLKTGTDLVSIKRTAGKATYIDGDLNEGVDAADLNQWYLRRQVSVDEVDISWEYLTSTPSLASGSGIEYWEYYAKIFFVREFSNAAADGVPTLCVSRLQSDDMATDCLVEGIEHLQIEFGIDTSANGTPNQYKVNPTASDMADVVAARIYLLVRGINPIQGYTNDKFYQVGSLATSQLGPFNDGYLRRVFSTTVQLRNAVLPNN